MTEARLSEDEVTQEPGQDAQHEADPPVADDVYVTERRVGEAVGSLIRQAYDHAIETKKVATWQEFAVKVLYEDRKDASSGERVRMLSLVRVEIPDTLIVRMLVNYCRHSGIDIPALLERFKPRPADQRPQVRSTKTFKEALGLNKNKADESIENYCGRYLLFTLDPEQQIIVTSYLLSQEKGDDGSPIFQARRRVADGTLVRSVGAYFSNERQLYLVGTPVGSIEMRLSIFHSINVNTHIMVRGVNLRMAESLITSTRCMLVRDDFRVAIRKDLLKGSHSRKRIANYFFEPKQDEPLHPKLDGSDFVYPQKDSRRANFKEIVNYLYDENPTPPVRPPYILVKGNIDLA
ncbi:hypothetical protein AC630_27840 [Bradyrhizobium sp. AS23.2]|nr:hypothetical protein AC630_27840 [Bradyrhizobium sp. AS23.2]